MAAFNDRRSSAGESNVLTSQWTGLSPHLIARFFPVKRLDGGGWEQSRDTREISAADQFTVDDGYEVHCPITDGTQEMTLNWQSPFEGSGPESKAPALSAMLQSGSLSNTLQAAGEQFGISTQGAIGEALATAIGRTGVTKLNSTQVFSGMPPIKRTLTLHFRALFDPVAEVQRPIQQLEEWAVPQYLAADGLIANAVNNGGKQNLMQTVFPSLTPQIIGMKYGNETLMPMVIESMSKPFTNPRSQDGVLLSVSIQMQISTLNALDRRDIQALYR